ncbi:GntR family transcriptional regulator [Xanthobacter autotrophicus]|uniref:GntR family transcriptional regulator n=1 Tax=Xanthobacter autotrophicus TaxID=280 RepID=UPI00372B2BEE
MTTPASLSAMHQAASLKKQVIEALRSAVLEGRFQPGDRLVEREVCEMFQVSRTLLREALSQLAAEGIVQIIPHRGPIVAVYSAQDARAIYELRATLEEMAGRCFTERATAAERKALETAFSAFKKACRGKPGNDLLVMKTAFYAALTAGAHNPVLEDMLRMIHWRVTMLRAHTLSRPGRLARSLEEIGEIMEAIARRDPEAAGLACRRHVTNAAAIASEILTQKEAELDQPAPKTRTGVPRIVRV